MNKVTVSDGRLPEQVGECLADDDMGYKVGDIITLKSGTALMSISPAWSKYGSPVIRMDGSEARIPEKNATPSATIKRMDRTVPAIYPSGGA